MITKTAKDAVNDATLARAMGRGGNTPGGVINSETNWAPLKSGKALFNRLDAVAKPNSATKGSSTRKRKNNTSSKSTKKKQLSKKLVAPATPVITKDAPKPVAPAPIAKPAEKPTVATPVKPAQKPAQSSYAETLGSYLANKVKNAVRYGRDFLRDSARGYKDLYNFVTDKQFRTQLGF